MTDKISEKMAAQSQPGPAGADLRYLSLLWAVQEQAGDIARLHASLFETGWSEASILQILAHPGSVALVAGAGTPRQIGGFVLAQVAADEAEILSVGVVPGWQRQGVGVKLIQGAKRAAAKSGAKRMFLEVAQSNAAALALYAKAGFTETGRRKGYYVKPGAKAEDAILFGAATT